MKSKGKIPILIGLLFIAAALIISGYNLYLTRSAREASNSALLKIMDIMNEERTSEVSAESEQDIREVIPNPEYKINSEMPMPIMEIDGKDYVAVLSIPSLDIELPILSEYEYDHLKIAPCRYSGSIYTNDIVICAHNYKSHFGRLKDISIDDRITLMDMNGNVFNYEVKEVIALDPTDMDEFIENGYALTLFTCTYGGSSRVTVRCDLKESHSDFPMTLKIPGLNPGISLSEI